MSDTPTATELESAFWQAMLRCDDDPRVNVMEMPCFSRTLKDSLVDGYLPNQLWGHMEAALATPPAVVTDE